MKLTITRVLLFILLLASCQSAPIKTIPSPTQTPVDTATPLPTTTQQPAAIIGSQTVNGVTFTLDWVLVDAKRISFGYTIQGLPDVPEARDLFGSIQLVEKSGMPNMGGYGGHSRIERVKGSSGTLVGSLSAVFATPFNRPKGNFSLDVILGDDSEMYNREAIIASLPFPASATPYPPNVFPPKLPDHKIGNFHFDFETEVFPLLSLVPDQSLTSNQVNMRLVKLEITASFTAATLCYSRPSSRDWIIPDATLKIGGQETPINIYSLISNSDDNGDQEALPHSKDSPQLQNARCVQLTFLAGHGNQSSSAILIIPRLEISMPESIPDADLAAAREKLLPQGIDIDWKNDFQGMCGPVYNKLPEGMTKTEAYQLFVEALGYIHQGPWEFSVNVNP